MNLRRLFIIIEKLYSNFLNFLNSNLDYLNKIILINLILDQFTHRFIRKFQKNLAYKTYNTIKLFKIALWQLNSNRACKTFVAAFQCITVWSPLPAHQDSQKNITNYREFICLFSFRPITKCPSDRTITLAWFLIARSHVCHCTWLCDSYISCHIDNLFRLVICVQM